MSPFATKCCPLVHPTPYLSDTALLRPASILILSLLLIDTSEAQIQLDRFFPCAVTAGTPTKVKAEGKFPLWPIEIICDREDVQWQVGEESGQLEFTVDENAAQGVAWVRVMDKTSSSDLIPLLITNTQTLSETEPNQNPKDANLVTTPICIVGRLEKRGDLDGFRFQAKRGERFNISLTANRILASPMDAVLQISDPKGNVLFQEDDTLGLDPHIRFLCPEDGEYLVRVFAFPETPNSTIGYAGAADYLYVLDIVPAESFVEHFLPLHGVPPHLELGQTNESSPFKFQPSGWVTSSIPPPQFSPPSKVSPLTLSVPGKVGWQWHESPRVEIQNVIFEAMASVSSESTSLPIQTVPFSFSGHLLSPKEIDSVSFDVLAGKRYRAAVQSKRLGFPIDTVLRVVSTDAEEEIAKNDDQSRNQFDSVVTFTAKEEGTLTLQVTDAVDGYGPHHVYSVIVEEVVPTFELSVSAQRFSIEPGKDVDITVTVTRKDGFDEPINVALGSFDNPEQAAGISAEAVKSEPKGDSSKSVTLKIKTQPETDYRGWIEIMGRTDGAEENDPGSTSHASFALRPELKLQHLWLNVKGKE